VKNIENKGLDISLFERMVINGMQKDVLTE